MAEILEANAKKLRCHKCGQRKNISRCGASHYCPAHRREWIEKLRRRSREAAAERKAAGIRDHEPSEAELELLISKQMQNLPSWWRKS